MRNRILQQKAEFIELAMYDSLTGQVCKVRALGILMSEFWAITESPNRKDKGKFGLTHIPTGLEVAKSTTRDILELFWRSLPDKVINNINTKCPKEVRDSELKKYLDQIGLLKARDEDEGHVKASEEWYRKNIVNE
jgi:hypothetical protein